MKQLEILKIRWVRLAIVSASCLFAPYVVALIRSADSAISDTLAAKLIFVFAATALTVLCAVRIRNRAVRITVTAAVWAALELLVVLEAFMFCSAGHSFDQSFLFHFHITAIPGEALRSFWKPVIWVLPLYFAAVAAVAALAGKTEVGKSDPRKLTVLILALLLFLVPETPGVILIRALADMETVPRRKLDYNEYVAWRQKLSVERGGNALPLLSGTIRMTGDEQNPTIHIGDRQVKGEPFQEHSGIFAEFNAGTGAPSSWKGYLDRGCTAFFRTNHIDRNFFYILCARKENLFHFIFGGREPDKGLLAAVVGGWYKAAYAGRLSELTLSRLNEPLPGIARAEIDVSHDIVALKKGGWTFPLFSKTGTYIPQCAVFAVADLSGNEFIARADFHDESAMDKLYNLLAAGDGVTVIAPPDSPLHLQYDVPEARRDEIMRLHVTPGGEKIELIPMRRPGEGYIARDGDGQYLYRRSGTAEARFRLVGDAPAADFGHGLCYAVTYNQTKQRIVVAKSFVESKTAASMMLNRNSDEKTLLICGKNSEFLKKYYPHLAEHNVLFSITPSAIRHAVQYGNGNFRIPAAGEPLDAMDGANVQLADDLLIVNWGNISFAIPEETFRSASAAGSELAVKLPHHDPANVTLFYVNDPSWLPDIITDVNTDFLLLGDDRSKLPGMLRQQRKAKFFVGISRGSGWKTYWSDGIGFRIGRDPAGWTK